MRFKFGSQMSKVWKKIYFDSVITRADNERQLPTVTYYFITSSSI